jgi:hypothetical protein
MATVLGIAVTTTLPVVVVRAEMMIGRGLPRNADRKKSGGRPEVA